jgi:hypothetical protein
LINLPKDTLEIGFSISKEIAVSGIGGGLLTGFLLKTPL